MSRDQRHADRERRRAELAAKMIPEMNRRHAMLEKYGRCENEGCDASIYNGASLVLTKYGALCGPCRVMMEVTEP